MPTFTHTIDIDASPDRVWTVMREIEQWPEWTASISSVERLDPGPLGAGSRARVKQPKLPPSLFVITDWQPGRGFDWTATSPGVAAVARHVIEPVGRTSRVTLSIHFSGWLAPLVGWLYGGLTCRYLQMEAEGLKRRAEQGDAGVPQ